MLGLRRKKQNITGALYPLLGSLLQELPDPASEIPSPSTI